MENKTVHLAALAAAAAALADQFLNGGRLIRGAVSLLMLRWPSAVLEAAGLKGEAPLHAFQAGLILAVLAWLLAALLMRRRYYFWPFLRLGARR